MTLDLAIREALEKVGLGVTTDLLLKFLNWLTEREPLYATNLRRLADYVYVKEWSSYQNKLLQAVNESVALYRRYRLELHVLKSVHDEALLKEFREWLDKEQPTVLAEHQIALQLKEAAAIKASNDRVSRLFEQWLSIDHPLEIEAPSPQVANNLSFHGNAKSPQIGVPLTGLAQLGGLQTPVGVATAVLEVSGNWLRKRIFDDNQLENTGMSDLDSVVKENLAMRLEEDVQKRQKKKPLFPVSWKPPEMIEEPLPPPVEAGVMRQRGRQFTQALSLDVLTAVTTRFAVKGTLTGTACPITYQALIPLLRKMPDLTAWEVEFLASVEEQASRRILTEKQEEAIKKIAMRW